MPTKATLKLVKQLQQKKYRKEHGFFVVEGIKSVKEFMKSDFRMKFLFATEHAINDFPKAEICTPKEMQQMSNLKSPSPILAVFEQQHYDLPDIVAKFSLAVDNVQDPGNLGTIIRLADWFGIKYVFCNESTVEVYNPKVIQACMGSLTRVQVHYMALDNFLSYQEIPIYGTFMDGENLYTSQLPKDSIVVLGNEAHGISTEIEKLCTNRIAIPQADSSTESLNVAIAAGITIGEFYRQNNF